MKKDTLLALSSFLKLILICLFAVNISVLLSCGDSKDTGKSDVKNNIIEKTKTVSKVPAREDFEKRLSELNIPLYKGAAFDKVEKNKHGKAYSIFYIISDNSSKSIKAVNSFYGRLANRLVKARGWKRIGAGNLIMLRDKKGLIVSISNVISFQSRKHMLQIQLNF